MSLSAFAGLLKSLQPSRSSSRPGIDCGCGTSALSRADSDRNSRTSIKVGERKFRRPSGAACVSTLLRTDNKR